VTVELPQALAGATFTDALGGAPARAEGRMLALRVPATFGTVLLAQVPKPASTAQANVHVLSPLTMPGLDRERAIRIYLPPGYEHSRRRYPVLYMHDGQNLFDAATSFLGEWGVDETLNTLAKSRKLELIVVGIDNGGDKRITELDPWDNAEHGKQEGREYLRFIVDVVKPYVDSHYRTKPGRTDTAMMGSSLGGLISHYAMFEYAKVFGKIGILSPAYWYAPPVFDFTSGHALRADTRVYFYAGGNEDEHMVQDMQRIVALIRQQRFPEHNLSVRVEAGAQHNEAAWRAEFPRAVEWLFDR
jgi:predicted alpha/beta superfamily hydrolase